MDLSFIILTWNSKRFLENCFDSIIRKCAEENIAYEIIVVDNGSTDGSLAVFAHYGSLFGEKFRTVYLPENRGTTYTRNLGLRMATGKHICILDSDTEVGEGSLRAAFKHFNTDPSLGMIAPRLLLPDGSVQNSVKKFPTFWHKLVKIPRAVWGMATPNGDFYEGFPFQEESMVDSAISACWIFPRRLTEEVGFLDENIFYSPEDLDYCVRIRKAGKKILYSPHLTVLHHTQQISHKKPLSKTSLSHFWGLLYYYRKHGCWISSSALNLEQTSAPALNVRDAA